jgi:hypothetical protein
VYVTTDSISYEPNPTTDLLSQLLQFIINKRQAMEVPGSHNLVPTLCAS